MLENKNILIELKENYIRKSKFNNKGIATEIESYGYNALNNVNIGVNGRKLFILVEDEEIFFKLITIPKSKKEDMYKIIKNEIMYYFNENKNIVFTYSILKENKDTVDVLVFCLNSEKINILEKHIYKSRLEKVCLIQFCFLNYFDRFIENRDFIFIFGYNDKLYFLGCLRKQMIANLIIKSDPGEEEIVNTLNTLVNKCINVYPEIEINTIYFANYYNDCLKQRLIKQYNCEYLSSVDSMKIINYFTANRRKFA